MRSNVKLTNLVYHGKKFTGRLKKNWLSFVLQIIRIKLKSIFGFLGKVKKPWFSYIALL